MNIVLLGAPASGKGTQSEKIISEFNFFHVSTGDIIRSNINNQTEYGIKSKKFVNEGKLVPYSLIIDMISAFLKENKMHKKIIWDGFPRTIIQAKELDKLLQKNGQKVDIVFYLKVSKHIARERIVNRVVCPKCKRSYSLKFLTPLRRKKCPIDDEFLVKRLDDDLSKFDTRLEVYNLQTKILLQHYKNVAVEIDANSSSEDAWNKIKEHIIDYD